MSLPTSSWHPSYWLAALGAGGLSISFFMYLMWLVPHPGFPMPTWAHIAPVITGKITVAAGIRPVVSAAWVLMILLALLHFILLAWNIRAHARAAATPAAQKLFDSPARLQFLSRPLALTMTVNVLFALGATLVPGLWSVVEWLFPLALAAFIVLGVGSLRLFGQYMSQVMVVGGYRYSEQNHLSPLLAVFTFSMLSVGLAAPAAMSQVAAIAVPAATLSILFLVLSVLLGLLILISGWQAMMLHGLQSQASPSVWMLIPILTLLAIEWVRIQHGLSHHFSRPVDASHLYVILTTVFMLQLGILALGFRIMVLNGYLLAQLRNHDPSPVSFGLICPGVAIVVMGMFWWHVALVDNGVLQAGSLIYWLGIVVLAVIQFTTLAALVQLSRRLFLQRPVSLCT